MPTLQQFCELKRVNDDLNFREEDEHMEIEKNIPIPSGRKNPSSIANLLREMKIGDSFEGEFSASNIHTYGRFAGIKVTVRKQQNGKHRCWRIA